MQSGRGVDQRVSDEGHNEYHLSLSSGMSDLTMKTFLAIYEDISLYSFNMQQTHLPEFELLDNERSLESLQMFLEVRYQFVRRQGRSNVAKFLTDLFRL